jgi:aquaporin Z
LSGNEPPFGRQLLAEIVGTFFLTFVAAGAEVAGVLSDGRVGDAAKAMAPGLVVLALIYASGDVSGAHFNPAVTSAFALRGVFPWAKLPAYVAAQLAGSCLAAIVLRALFGTLRDVGVTRLTVSVGKGLALEVIITALLVLIILNTAHRHSIIGTEAALAVGATIALAGLFAGPLSGASMNPARSLGPALVSGATNHVWVYIVGPLAGAGAATALSFAFHPDRNEDEDEAAEGDGR